MLEFVEYDRRFLDLSYVWLTDAETKRLTMAPDFTKEEQIAFFESLPYRKDYKIWGVSYDGKPIGAAGLKKITANDAEYWAYIGQPDFRGLGLGRSIINTIVEIANEMELTFIYLHVACDNLRPRILYEKMGFVAYERNGLIIKMKLEL